MYEEVLESYAEQLTNSVSGLENSAVTEEMEEKRQKKRSVKVVTPENVGESLHICGIELWKVLFK